MPMNRKARHAPSPRNTLRYSIVIPAYNEAENVGPTLTTLAGALRAEGIPFELTLVNDNSTDNTVAVVEALREQIPEILLVHNVSPGGFGRAIRCGLANFTGDVVAVVMADLSDSPEDVVACYREIEKGFDCCFGSRFIKGSRVTLYPKVKLLVNRLVNRMLGILFATRHNDLTNAFKVYRREVIESISPLHASHFNITIELSLSALVRRFSISTIPIAWSGRTWGASNLKLKEMGRRYLCTLLMIWFERLLIMDDLLVEDQRKRAAAEKE